MPDLHALIITHTHERITNTLMGLRAQTLTPKTITVACDSDDKRIQPEIQRAADALDQPITLALRARGKIACRSQNRNNAFRALLDQDVRETDHIFFIDGDCIPSPSACKSHSDALKSHQISLGWAVRLSSDQTEALTEQQILNASTNKLLTDEQRQSCRKAHLQTHKRILLRSIKLTKPHKPGILSGNFGVRLHEFRTVNGFDESFTGWGMEDDDLARRLYMIGARPKSVMNKAVVFHQHHPTEEPPNWKDSPNAHRLSEPCEAQCKSGIKNPAPQNEMRVYKVIP